MIFLDKLMMILDYCKFLISTLFLLTNKNSYLIIILSASSRNCLTEELDKFHTRKF